MKVGRLAEASPASEAFVGFFSCVDHFMFQEARPVIKGLPALETLESPLRSVGLLVFVKLGELIKAFSAAGTGIGFPYAMDFTMLGELGLLAEAFPTVWAFEDGHPDVHFEMLLEIG